MQRLPHVGKALHRGMITNVVARMGFGLHCSQPDYMCAMGCGRGAGVGGDPECMSQGAGVGPGGC